MFGRMSAMAMVAELAGLAGAERIAKFNELGGYHSRGKGRYFPSPRFIKSNSKYMPHQGKQEIARRAARFS